MPADDDVVVGTCLDLPRPGPSREQLWMVLRLVPQLTVPWSSLSTRKLSIRGEVYSWSPFPRPSPPSNWPKGNDWVGRDEDSY